MLNGIEVGLWERKLHPILCSVYFDIEQLETYFQSLLQQNISGIIFAPLKGAGYLENNQKIIKMLRDKHIPIVLLDRYIPGMLINSVVSDNRQGSKELTKHLRPRNYGIEKPLHSSIAASFSTPSGKSQHCNSTCHAQHCLNHSAHAKYIRFRYYGL